MKKRKKTSIVGIVLCMALLTAVPIQLRGQEAESKTVVFQLNNVIDNQAPTITILSPSPGQEERVPGEAETIEVIGEVIDATSMRFVSINNDNMWWTKPFASRSRWIWREQIRVKSMDENGNMQEKILFAGVCACRDHIGRQDQKELLPTTG